MGGFNYSITLISPSDYAIMKWFRIKVGLLYNTIRTIKGMKCLILLNTPMVLEHLFDMFVELLLFHVIREYG